MTNRSTAALSYASRRVGGVPVAVLALITSGCALALAAEAGGGRAILALPAWQALTAAMMLPSSLPMVRLFVVTARLQRRRKRVIAAFLAGYAAVWTAFALAAFLGDVIVHVAVDRWSWLAAHDHLIGAGVVAIAAALQFTAVKDRLVTQRGQPAAYLIRHYRRGVKGAFSFGGGHGLYCLGCCWTLMLVMFAAGVASLFWMGMLTALMAYRVS